MICECCLADLSNKPNYATLLVNKDGVVFTWIYCDVHCLANDWQGILNAWIVREIMASILYLQWLAS